MAQRQNMEVQRKIECPKEELERILGKKFRQSQEAQHTLANAISGKLKEPTNEFSGANDALMLVKKTGNDLEAKNSYKEKGMLNYQCNPLSDWQGVNIAIEELESNLTLATEDLHRLQQELITGEETQEFISQAASQALADLDRVKSELERSLKVVKDPCSASCSPNLSLRSTTSGDLEKALRIGGCLESSMKSLRIELEGMRKEVGNLREREANARAAVLMLTQELFKTKDDVLKAIQAETKAQEAAIPDLSMISENTKTEADFGKEELNVILREEEEDANEGRMAGAHLHDFHCSLINASILQPPHDEIEKMRGHPILHDQSVMIYKRMEKKKKKKFATFITGHNFGEKELSNQ